MAAAEALPYVPFATLHVPLTGCHCDCVGEKSSSMMTAVGGC
jgi:hypothetical protein